MFGLALAFVLLHLVSVLGDEVGLLCKDAGNPSSVGRECWFGGPVNMGFNTVPVFG